MNFVSITATVTGQIKNIPQVSGICSTVETVYVASSHPQEGGIFMFDYGDLLCSSAQLKIVVENGTQYCNIVHGISLRTEDEIVYSDVSAKVVRTVSITENLSRYLVDWKEKRAIAIFSTNCTVRGAFKCIRMWYGWKKDKAYHQFRWYLKLSRASGNSVKNIWCLQKRRTKASLHTWRRNIKITSSQQLLCAT